MRFTIFDYEPSDFIEAGEMFCDPDLVPDGLRVLGDNSAGYDGQFYYRMALDPFGFKTDDFGITFDAPSYRQQRIMYPLIVWGLSLGRPELVPIMMILVNYFALCLIAYLGGLFAQSMKQHALWGLIFAIYPGFILSFARDLAEIVAVCFLFLSLFLLRNNKHLFATLFLTLAMFTRETTLMVAVAALLIRFLVTDEGKSNDKLKWYFFVIPIVSYFGWQLFLFLKWAEWPFPVSSYNFGLPLLGIINFFKDRERIDLLVYFSELCFIVAFAISVLKSLGSTVATKHEKLSWLLYAIPLLFASRDFWAEDWGFLRFLSEFYIIGSLIILGSKFKLKLLIFVCSLVFWLYLFKDRMP
ncbi:MAG: hypothetical protein KJ593_03110 [Candidatus Omnitrophica bacterium]|nr:hypothetical protein [Candidatus Omnitrophota bacterium]